ncbi:MAG: OmpA family protein [Desulfobacteraceae bacterium]|nr:OmpA family protein [Desulfobacteraceae bacterium]MDH3723287.1 OmpA family protein [Desulfobacteraceae bacterium]MDH3836815.1 OmpA family protein [Desulfobacteraceae bacterium]
MKNLFIILSVLGLVFFSFTASHVIAAEKVVEQETVTTVSQEPELVKTADNFIILFDSSSSMNEPYGNTSMTKLTAAKEILKEKNKTLPDLGYNAGLYLLSNFKPIYAVQKYDREKVAAALDQLPEKGSGATLFVESLSKLRGVLAELTGKTVLFFFTDGYYTPTPGMKKPVQIAKELADKHDVCFYIISTAKGAHHKEILKNVASINPCSRVVPFEYLLGRPEYMTGALYEIDVKTIETVKTIDYLAGFKVDNVQFDFNSSVIPSASHEELNKLGDFLREHPKTYVVLSGYTDITGSDEYNLWLARRRAEKVQDYLTKYSGVSIGRIITQWYGKKDPVADNTTEEGRQQNRRVESVVMGLD